MPLKLTKIYEIAGNYTNEEKEILISLVRSFRLKMADDDSEKNIVNKKSQQYSDNKIIQLLEAATSDINSGNPRTEYSLFHIYKNIDDDIIVNGAMIFALIAEGILQIRNQVSFNDSGLSVSIFDKTGAYQGWANFLLQQYAVDKAEIKRSVLARSKNSGFVGVGSEFGYGGWY